MTIVLGDNSTSGFTGSAFNLTTPKQLEGGIHEIVLPAGQKITEFGLLWMATPANGTTGTRSFQMGIYDLDTETLISSTATTISYNTATLVAGGANVHVKSSGLSIDLSAYAGKRIGIGLASPSAGSGSGFVVGIRTLAGSTRNNHSTAQASLPATFAVTSSTANSSWGAYAILDDVSPPSVSLDSVTPSPVTNAQTLTAIISGNMASGSASLVSGGLEVSQAVGSWAYDSGTGKTTVVAPVVQGGLAFGVITAKYVSGATTLTQSITLSPIAGNIQVAISGGLTDPGYIFEQLASGSVGNVSHVEHTDSPNTVVSAQGAISQSIVRPFQARARDGSDNTWGPFSTIYTVATAVANGVSAVASVGAVAASGAVVARPVGLGVAASIGDAIGLGQAIVQPTGVAAFCQVGTFVPYVPGFSAPLGVMCVCDVGGVVASATVSGVSLQQVKNYLDVIHDGDDEKLQLLLDAASDEAMNFMDRTNLEYWGAGSCCDSVDISTLSRDMPPSVKLGILILVQAAYQASPVDQEQLRKVAEVKLMPHRCRLGV
ncbi:head-tail connector protein [Cellvibrio sp. KY-GH-1]|uniref:head-tail connector protein n=1 Tax=Cellvibrio sp. KY-GH-1 TaxID=2303332 RepID=UPI001CD986BA|nr:head-tail connector protein [Cellvibrio sp. KY-GH-1]